MHGSHTCVQEVGFDEDKVEQSAKTDACLHVHELVAM